MADCEHEFDFSIRVCKQCGWTMEEVVDGKRREYVAAPTIAKRRLRARNTNRDILVRTRAEALANAFLDGMSYALKGRP